MNDIDLSKFWEKVSLAPSGCWEWTGLCHPFGYGRITINKKQYLAHRLSYEVHHGVIMDSKLCVCHKCDNPLCVNPEHLFLGTRRDNNLDRTNKGRTFKGSKVTSAKLVEQQVIDIRNSTQSVTAIAKHYGISTSTVYAVKSRSNWKHLK